MSGLVTAVRVAMVYDGVTADIISATFIEAADPQIGLPVVAGTDGATLRLRGPDGTVVFSRTLPDPGTALEIAGDSGALSRSSIGRQRFLVVEVPWPGPGTTIEVRLKRPGIELERPPALIPLVPVHPVELEGTAPPLVVHPIWGAQNPPALTLLFLPDGFVADEMPVFHAAVEQCVRLFGVTEPFASQTAALRVAHVDIVSNESGIAGTQGRDTAFGSHFQPDIDRVILVDQARALKALNSYVSHGSGVAMVVANTPRYGGSGGGAMVFSCDARSSEIALHELGHSAFGLADEYADAGQSATDDPVEPNVCGFGDRARLKWADLVPATTALPSLSADDPVPSPPPRGVGAYEGAKYHTRGRFRPEFDCKMRTLGQPFCAVCARTITGVLSRHLPSA